MPLRCTKSQRPDPVDEIGTDLGKSPEIAWNGHAPRPAPALRGRAAPRRPRPSACRTACSSTLPRPRRQPRGPRGAPSRPGRTRRRPSLQAHDRREGRGGLGEAQPVAVATLVGITGEGRTVRFTPEQVARGVAPHSQRRITRLRDRSRVGVVSMTTQSSPNTGSPASVNAAANVDFPIPDSPRMTSAPGESTTAAPWSTAEPGLRDERGNHVVEDEMAKCRCRHTIVDLSRDLVPTLCSVRGGRSRHPRTGTRSPLVPRSRSTTRRRRR